jgi:multidrug transporter EmrE-like cation transporter
MGSSTTIPPIAEIPENPARPSVNPVYLVVICTLFAASAQILLKFGALHPLPSVHLSDSASVGAFLTALLGDWPLIIGYSLHACNAMLLILALRHGHLSLLYPLYALSYVWVDLLSLYYFHEHMNIWKEAGITLIIAGVAVLGKASRE